MANFISLTDTKGTELNININFIVMFLKTSETLKGESMVVTTTDKFQVMETSDEIDDLIKAAEKRNKKI